MSKKIANQKQTPVSVVEMDARKFLRRLNAGAQSQVAVFSERIREMGKKVNENWELVSLEPKNLIFQEQSTGKYYTASINKKSRSQVQIESIREVRVVESEEKEKHYVESLLGLIESIKQDDIEKADNHFKKIAMARFQRGVIPEHGIITTRDGINRFVPMRTNVIDEHKKPEIIKKICDVLEGSVKVSRGRIVEGTFNNSTIKLPVNEFTRRRIIARKMKKVALEAYKSDGFQKRIKHCASLVSEGREGVKNAIKNLTPFLVESQEFCLLTLQETQDLVGNALAAQGCMNHCLADDLGTLMYRTNAVANHDTILEDWKLTARKAEYPPLVKNVKLLGESKNFASDYGIFLGMVFNEDVDTRTAKAKIYLTALKDMRDVISGGGDEELTESLEDLIMRMEEQGNEIDDATLMEAEELVASVSENLLDDAMTLSDFDAIPEPDAEPDEFGDMDLGDEAGDEDLGLGGSPGADLPFGDEGLEGEEEDLGDEDLAGVLAEPGEEEEEEEEFSLESAEREGKVMSEDQYAYDSPDVKIGSYGFGEDHSTWPNKVTQTKEGGQKGKKEPSKGDAMGCQGEPEMNVKKDAGHSGDTPKKTGLGENIVCPECSEGDIDPAEALTEDGAVCPACGADIYTQVEESLGIAENIAGAGHEMDVQGGKGVAQRSLTKSDGRGDGGKKVDIEKIGPQDCVTGCGTQDSDGRSFGGKSDGMDGQDGKSIAAASMTSSDGKSAGSGGGEASEDQYKDGTRRRRMAMPVKGRATLNATEESVSRRGRTVSEEMKAVTIVTDKDIDEIVQALNSAEDGGLPPDIDDMGDMEGEMGDMEGEMGDEDELIDQEQDDLEDKEEFLDDQEDYIEGEEDELEGEEEELEGEEEELEDEEEEDEENELSSPEEFGEGKLPPALEKHKFKKSGESEDEDDGSAQTDECSMSEEDGEEDGEGEEDECSVSEDNDIGKPQDSGHDSADAARKDGDGKQMNPKPTFSDKDYDGTKAAKLARPLKD